QLTARSTRLVARTKMGTISKTLSSGPCSDSAFSRMERSPGIEPIKERIWATAIRMIKDHPPVRCKNCSKENRLNIISRTFLVHSGWKSSQPDSGATCSDSPCQLADRGCQDGLHVGGATDLVRYLEQDTFALRLGADLLEQPGVRNDRREAASQGPQ